MESTGWLFSPLFPGRIGIWKCWFLQREENWSTRRKTLRAGTRTNNKLNPHDTEPRNQTWATLVGGLHGRCCSLYFNNTYSGLGHLNPAGQSLQVCFPASPNVVVPSGQRTALCFGDGHMYPIGHSVQFA